MKYKEWLTSPLQVVIGTVLLGFLAWVVTPLAGFEFFCLKYIPDDILLRIAVTAVVVAVALGLWLSIVLKQIKEPLKIVMRNFSPCKQCGYIEGQDIHQSVLPKTTVEKLKEEYEPVPEYGFWRYKNNPHRIICGVCINKGEENFVVTTEEIKSEWTLGAIVPKKILKTACSVCSKTYQYHVTPVN